MQAVGRRVTFFTNTAVSTENKVVSFYIMPDDGMIDGGATMDHSAGEGGKLSALLCLCLLHGLSVVPAAEVEARGIDMAEFMLREVIGRRIPPLAASPAILMKSDIEGTDMAVMDHLFRAGVLCHVHTVYGEHMDELWLANMLAQLKAQGCATRIILSDDEVGQVSLFDPANDCSCLTAGPLALAPGR